MDLKSREGSASLRDDSIVLTFSNKTAATPDKRALSPRVIPLNHVWKIDFRPPTKLIHGYLRIIVREHQKKLNPVSDTYAVGLSAWRKSAESKEFVAQLKAAVDAVEYETPSSLSAEEIKRETPVSFKEVVSSFQDLAEGFDDVRKSNTSFRGISLAGRTLTKGRKSWPASECEIIIDNGANVSSRVTATRVAAGAMLAGSTGALIGSIAKKDRSSIYMTVITPDDIFIEHVSGLDEVHARDFAMKVKRAGMLQIRETAAGAKRTVPGAPVTILKSTPVPPPGVPAGWYPRGNVQQYWDGNDWTQHTAPLV
ncbi:DUF4429 domain-containing protein [Arthrobacter sp. ok362]|uniref:DUF4429 domain-containing protein n=1 Tax=Arthrobacter sp. ok362 TaxID=1761745 RepID=UPI00088D4F21|nr:DUF4429 domain-containing protein [Arthrobacter sp. ok362]SDM03003.1 Protein of unknown function [Arthrobacter sp. ok362]